MDTKTEELIFKGIRSQKQRMFILLYCNPESPSYDNGTQSYLKAYDSDNTNVGAVESHGLLNKPHIIKSIERYRAYIHENNGFELDWLDDNLRNLYYKVKNDGLSREELSVLKTIGDRIGAFKDQAENKEGVFIPLTAEQEKLASQVIKAIMDEEKEKDRANRGDIGKDIQQIDLHDSN